MARKLTIMGAGGTGLALAAEWTLAGHDVTLYDDSEHEDILAAVRRTGHIEADRPEGKLKAPAPATVVGHDRLALHAADTELFAFCCTAWRQEAMIEAVLPFLRDGQALLFAPGNAGSLRFRRMLGEYGVRSGRMPQVVVGEMEGNWFPCRRTGPASVFQALPLAPHAVAAFPAVDTPRLVKRLEGLLEARPGTCVLEAALNSPNVVIHLAASLLNIGGMEKKGKGFCLFRDGLTPAVCSVVEKVNAEKEAVFAAYGWTPRSPLALLREIMRGEPSEGLRRFVSLSGPDRPEHRYLREDAMCGASLLHQSGRLAGVETPVLDAALTLAGVLHGCEYMGEKGQGVTLRSLGFSGKKPEELNDFLTEQGEKDASCH